MKAIASGVTRIEYRVGDEIWHAVDMDTLQIQVPNVEADTILHLNLYGKKKKPIVSYSYRFDDILGTWVLEEAMAQAASETAALETSTEPVEAISSLGAPPMDTDSAFFDLKAIASGVTRIEYRIGDEGWYDLDMSTMQLQLPYSEDGTTLLLNVYGKAKKPVVTYDYRYDGTLGTWVHDEPVVETMMSQPSLKAEVVASSEEIAVPAVPIETDKPVLSPDSAFFDLKAIASGVTRIEYRIGDESWHDLDMSTMQIQLPYAEDETTLLLNVYGKAKKPVVTYDYRYDDTLGTWVHGEPIMETAVSEISPKAELAASSEEIAVPAVPIETDKPVLSPETGFFDLKAIASGVTKIEYSYEDESWHDVDMSTMQLQLPYSEDETTLLLNLYRGSMMPMATVSEAEEVTASGFFDLRDISSRATKIEYSYEDESWRDVDMESLQIELPYTEEDETILLINLYLGSKKPITIALEKEETVPPRDAMEVTLSPYATVMLTDNVLRHMYTLPFGLGLEAAFTFPFHRNLVFKVDAEVKFAKSNNIWAESFILFGGDVGIGYTFLLPAGFQLTPALSYGLFLHHGLESVLEKPLFFTHHVGLDVAVGYSVGHRIHAFVAPHVQMMLDTTRLGFLYGLRAGAGFLL